MTEVAQICTRPPEHEGPCNGYPGLQCSTASKVGAYETLVKDVLAAVAAKSNPKSLVQAAGEVWVWWWANKPYIMGVVMAGTALYAHWLPVPVEVWGLETALLGASLHKGKGS